MGVELTDNRKIIPLCRTNMSDESDCDSIPDPNMIEFSDEENPSESGESMASDDPFRQILENDNDEEPEPEFNFNPLDQIASGGIFSESADIASTIGGSETLGSVPASTLDGTSIIGDPSFTKKDTSQQKFKIPSAPDLTACDNKSMKRQLYARFLKEKKKAEKQRSAARREKRKNETDEERQAKRAAFGKTTAQVDYHQKTVENQRVWDETTVPMTENEKGRISTEDRPVEDVEVNLEQQSDEFADYFAGKVTPKVLITTSENARNRSWKLALELGSAIPNSFVLPRKRLAVKQIVKQATARNFTSVIVVNDDRGTPNGLLVSALPEGPTAHFKLTNPKLRCEMFSKNPKGNKGKGPDHAQPSSHRPELFLKRFGTRLGHRVGRMFASMYPKDPQFRGRQIVTLYNQRDYIFFRMHRYHFVKQGKKVNMQEMGPRFTLKLRSLQLGTFDSKRGDYEWIHKRHKMDSSRRKFHL